jgi:hypothetical protein
MRPRFPRSFALALSLGVALLLGWPAIGAEGQNAIENKVKAAFLYDFAVHTEWPAGAFAGPDAPLVIGLAGGVPFATVLKDSLQGKTLGGRRIVARAVGANVPADQCHLLFIGAVKPERATALLAAVAGKPVLTVSEAEGFAQRGGILNLFKEEGSIKFEANPDAAARAQLKLGSQLLKLARVIKDGSPARKD